MAIKISVYIAVSLDGFIARKNGGIDWLPVANSAGEDYGYEKFISSVDSVLMGRHTYEKALSFGAWPYSYKKVIVLSTGNPTIPPELPGKVEVVNRSPREVVNMLSDRGSKHVYLDGGKTIQLFLNEGLVEEMTITTIPILIGAGIPLFGPLLHDVKFQLIESKYFMNGLVQNKYRAERDG